jgi:hypothetical protein
VHFCTICYLCLRSVIKHLEGIKNPSCFGGLAIGIFYEYFPRH